MLSKEVVDKARWVVAGVGLDVVAAWGGFRRASLSGPSVEAAGGGGADGVLLPRRCSSGEPTGEPTGEPIVEPRGLALVSMAWRRCGGGEAPVLPTTLRF